MSSFAETAFRAAVTSGVASGRLINGSTFCAAKLFFGSSSTTRSFAVMAGSVVNRSPA